MIHFEREINKAFRPLRGIQIFASLLFISNAIIRFCLLVGIQRTIDSISIEISVTQKYLRYCMILVFLYFFINCIFQYFYRRLEYTSHYSLIKRLFSLALSKNYSFHGKYASSALLSMIKDDSKFISDWKSTGIMTVFINIVNLLLAFCIMIFYNRFITVAIFSIILLCFVSTHFISKAISNRTYKLQFSNTEVSKMIVEYINGVKDIKQYKKEKNFENQLSAFIDNNSFKHSKSISRFFSAFTSTYAMLVIALPILALLFGVGLILNNQLTMGELIALYAVVGTLQEPVQVIPDYLNKRRQALAMQKKVMPILEKEEEVYTVEMLNPLESFVFCSNSYIFEGGKAILKDVDFSLNKGDVIIIKGDSGKGKSSLLNLISRFYKCDAQTVSIKYNEIPIENIAPSVYYNHVVQAPQEAYIFTDTILNNITLGEKFTKEEIEEIIYTVCLDEVINSTGFDYIVEQNGENISGGQKQRIGLARAMLRKPDLLMLDEPISALNPELVSTITERIVQYCNRYKIALILVSHNDSFEKYYQRIKAENVQVINI